MHLCSIDWGSIHHRSMLHCTPLSCPYIIDPCYTVTPPFANQPYIHATLLYPLSLPKVSVQYAICETYMVYQSSMDLWSIGGGSSSASRSAKFSVVVFKASLLKGSIHHRSMLLHYTSPLPTDHRSMLHCYTPSVCQRYLCSRLYVKLMWCSGL